MVSVDEIGFSPDDLFLAPSLLLFGLESLCRVEGAKVVGSVQNGISSNSVYFFSRASCRF